MKKYIRTKKGNIIANPKPNTMAIKTNENEDFEIIETDLLIGDNGSCLKQDIVKQADAIEELCDEFVGINDGEYQFLRAIPYKCANYWNRGVYGCIWTNKGLQFVAKLNSEGVLELI